MPSTTCRRMLFCATLLFVSMSCPVANADYMSDRGCTSDIVSLYEIPPDLIGGDFNQLCSYLAQRRTDLYNLRDDCQYEFAVPPCGGEFCAVDPLDWPWDNFNWRDCDQYRQAAECIVVSMGALGCNVNHYFPPRRDPVEDSFT